MSEKNQLSRVSGGELSLEDVLFPMRYSGKKVLAGFGMIILIFLIGVVLFARFYLWPLMSYPHPHAQPSTLPATPVSQTGAAFVCLGNKVC